MIAQLPVEVATYLLNEKRDWVQSLEARHDLQVVLIANPALETPHYDVRRVRDDQAELPALAEAETELDVPPSIQERKVAEQAAIGKIEPTTPAPKRPEPVVPPRPGFWDWLKSLFSGDDEESAKQKTRKAKKKKPQTGRGRKGGDDAGRDRGKSQRGRRSETRKDDGPRSKKKTKKKTKKKAKKKASARDTSEQTQGRKQSSEKAADSGKDESTDDSRRGTRSRRSRGGRRRRRTGDKPAQDAETRTNEARKRMSPIPAIVRN